MIIGDLEYWEKEKQAYHPVFDRAIQFLRTIDAKSFEAGKVELEGTQMFAVLSESEAVHRSQRKSEHHKSYIDVQCLVESKEEEMIVVARQSANNQPVDMNFDDRDYALYDQVENEFEISMRPGMFAVFFPDDLHRPLCSKSGGGIFKKAVVKIHVSLLQ